MLPRKTPLLPLAFIKASRHPSDVVELTMDRIAKNTARGVMTSFIPDANVVIRMEEAADPRFPATDKTLAHYGLLEYINILRECGRNRLPFSVSPYFAFSELPAEKSALTMQRYYAFGQRFGINWLDDPEATTYPHVGRQGKASVWSLPDDERSFIALSYAHLLLMLYVKHTGIHRSPLENFEQYLYEVVSRIPLLSGREIGIASYAFADPEACSPGLIAICRDVRENFCKHQEKIPRTLEAMDACALNASYDLLMANFANLADTRAPLGYPLDNWIVTGDQKLALFMSLCHGYNFGTKEAGKAMAMAPQASRDGYMQAAQAQIKFLFDTRHQHPTSGATPAEMNSMLRRVTQHVEEGLAGFASTNRKRARAETTVDEGVPSTWQ